MRARLSRAHRLLLLDHGRLFGRRWNGASTLQAAPLPGSTGVSLHVSGTLNNNGNLTLGDPNALTDPPQMTDVSIRTLNLFSNSVTTIYDSGNTRTVLFDTDVLSCHRSPTATINDSRIGPMLGGCSADLP